MNSIDPSEAASSRRLETSELVYTAVFLPIAAFSWVGILLAELGLYSGWTVLVGGTLGSAVGLWAAARDYERTKAPRSRVPLTTSLALAVVVGLAAGLARPGEYLIEGADASVYVAIGRNLERTGRLIHDDPAIALVPQDLRQAFFQRDRRPPNMEGRLPGGMRIDLDGHVSPSFFHMLPVWIAIATSAAGPYGPYYVNVFFAVLGVVVIWLLGRRLWSPTAGIVAATLLAVNFGQIFHAGLPSSEMLSQFFLQSGIFFSVLAWDRRSSTAGACAGLAIGLAGFTRIDTLALAVPLAAAWLILIFRRQWTSGAWRWYAAMLVAVSGHAIVHAATTAKIYTAGLVGVGLTSLSRLPTHVDTLTLLGMIAVAAAAAFIAMKVRGRWLTGLGIAAVLVMGVVSPAVVGTTSLLLTPLGLVTALAGLVLGWARRWQTRDLPVILPFLASALLLLAWRETTTLPHDFRRLVPAILPGAMLLTGFLVSEVHRLGGWFRQAIWALPATLAVLFLVDAKDILFRPLAQDIHWQMADIAGHIPPNALVLSDTTVPGHMATALQYSFDRPTLRLSTRPPEGASLTPLIGHAQAAGYATYAVVAPFAEDRREGLRRSDLVDFAIPEEQLFPLAYEVLRPVRRVFPSERRGDDLTIAVYRIEPLDIETRHATPFTVDIGNDDFPFLIAGFHGAESSDSSGVRWTTGEARLAVPRLSPPASGQLALVVRFKADRPQQLPRPVVAMTVDGLPVDTITAPSRDMQEYRLALPEPVVQRMVAQPTILSIITDVFVPSEAGQNDDGRALGVLVDWLRIE